MMSKLYKMKQGPQELSSFFSTWLQHQLTMIAEECPDVIWSVIDTQQQALVLWIEQPTVWLFYCKAFYLILEPS